MKYCALNICLKNSLRFVINLGTSSVHQNYYTALWRVVVAPLLYISPIKTNKQIRTQQFQFFTKTLLKPLINYFGLFTATPYVAWAASRRTLTDPKSYWSNFQSGLNTCWHDLKGFGVLFGSSFGQKVRYSKKLKHLVPELQRK